jgi:putative ABC transport system substrate-binding protein
MRRRRIIAGLLLALAVLLGSKGAAGGEGVEDRHADVGALVDPAPRVAALRQALRERGYLDGQSIAIEPRGSKDIPRLYDLATDLVRSKDVIVTQGTLGVQAAQRATRTTPIVMVTSGDAVNLGLVASLARPGGNITGQTIIAGEYIGQRPEILREIVPSVSRGGSAAR